MRISTTPADNEARRRAVLERTTPLIVEAAPGTGKTALMAARLALIIGEGVDPATIVAVSFTELAAAELAERTRRVASELGAGETPIEIAGVGIEPDEAMRNRLRDAPIAEMLCTTIHGLCRTLLAAYGAPEHWTPGTTVCDALSTQRLREQVAAQWAHQRMGDTDAGAQVLCERMLDEPRATLGLLDALSRSNAQTTTPTGQAPPSMAEGAHALAEAVNALRRRMRSSTLREEGTEAIAQAAQALAERCEQWSNDENAGALECSTHTPDTTLVTKGGGWRAYRRKGKWTATAKAQRAPKSEAERMADEIGDAYAEIGLAWTQMQGLAAQRIARTLATLGAELHAQIEAAKRAQGVVEFDDLIARARTMLGTQPEVRNAVRERYGAILVDEFQDTDRAQAEIVWRMASAADTERWEDAPLRDGALFLVGDPKQAIYGFRGANIDAYLEAKARLASAHADAVVTITSNFRCRRAIVDEVNGRFANALNKSEGQPGFVAMHPERGEGGEVRTIDIGNAEAESTSSDERRRNEAQCVADLCVEWLEAGTPGAATPEDIALLAPSGTGLWHYENALDERGIAVASQAGKGWFDRDEVHACIAIARCVANPRDRVALGALLRSTHVGIADETLLDIAAALGAGSEPRRRYGVLDCTVDARLLTQWALVRDTVQTLQRLGERAHRATPFTLMGEALEHFEMKAVIEAGPTDTERGFANLERMLETARNYTIEGIEVFAHDLDRAWSDGARVVEGTPDHTEGAISLQTMHSAKGLEWPTVVIVNTHGAPRTSRPTVLVTDNGQIGFSFAGHSTSGYEEAGTRDAEERARERVRLWYVAATRARERLVLPAAGNDGERSWRAVLPH